MDKTRSKVNKVEYIEYVFVYVDDLLVISEDPQAILKTIGEIYRLKNDSVAKPTTYLRALIKEHRIPDYPKPIYSMSAEKYVEEAIEKLKEICIMKVINWH